MSIKISMILKAKGERYTEEDFRLKVKELSPYFENSADIDGLIHINHDNQQIEIDDDLGYNVLHLLLNGSINLLESGKTEMNYSAFEGKIVVTAINDYITFEGDYIQGAILPQHEFIRALIDCGKRYLEFLKDMEPEGKYDYLLKNMNPLLKKAEQLFKEKRLAM